MPLDRKSPKSENKDYQDILLLEAGDHDARLVFVADLGLQRKEYKGEYQGDFQQLALGLEIVGETVMIDGKEVPRMLWTKPFYIYDTLTEKGTEIKLFKVFDSSAQPGDVPDWDAQLGKPCNVVVVHNKGRGENANKEFDNIDAVTSIPVKYQEAVPPNVIEPSVGMDKNIEEHLYGLAKYVFDRRIQNAQDAYDRAAESQADY